MNDAGVSPAVGVAGHGGMPGMPELPPVPEYQRTPSTDSQEPRPPPQLSNRVADEVYAKVGAANDLVLVRRPDGLLTVSDFHLVFSRKERVKGAPPKAPSSMATANKAVHTYINGKLQPQLYLRVQEDGFCTFADGRLQPAPEALAMLAKDDTLVDGFNTVRFEIRYLRDPRVLVAECFAFVWDVNTPMIVVDIDGTITRSDVSGLVMTLSPGLITNHTHSGICSLLARMVDEAGAQVVYLTSRPISLAAKTRTFLASTEQEGKKLPLGPLRCCLEKVSGVLWRELVSKNMHDYKIAALLDLARPFREAGRTFGEAVFAAGIGNKVHDAVAYRAAGIPKDFIFLIDTESNLRVWDGDTSKMGGSRTNSPISPKKKKKLLDQQQQQEGDGKSPKTNTPTDSRRKRFSNRLFNSSSTSSSSSGSGSGSGRISFSGSNRPAGSGGGGGGGLGGGGGGGAGGHTAAALKEAASRQQFGEDEDESDDESCDDDEAETAAGGGGGGHADVGAAAQEQRLPTMAEESSWAGTDPQLLPPSSSGGGGSGGEGDMRGEGPGGVDDTGGGKQQATAGERKYGEGGAKAEGSAAKEENNDNGPPQHQEQQAAGAAGSAAAAVAAAPASSAAAPVDYQSYGDARFFDRLRASLDLAAWEAQKAVEAAAHATHAGVQAGVHGVQAGVHAAGSALSSGSSRRAQGEEGGEEAADRLAERVQEMSHRDLPE